MGLTGGFGVRLRHFRSESPRCTVIPVRPAKRNPTSPHLLKSVMVWSFDGNIRSPTVSYLLDSTCQGTKNSETLISVPVRGPYLWFCHLLHIFTIRTSPSWSKSARAVPSYSYLSVARNIHMSVIMAYRVHVPEKCISFEFNVPRLYKKPTHWAWSRCI